MKSNKLETQDFSNLNSIRIINPNFNKNALLGIVIFSFGCFFDHLTTAFGLTLPNLIESNPIVLTLIGYGIWHIFEVLVMGAGAFTGLIASRSNSNFLLSISCMSLTIMGFIRLYAGFNNLTLIFKVLY